MNRIDHLIRQSLEHSTAKRALRFTFAGLVHQHLEWLGEIHTPDYVNHLEIVGGGLEQLLE